jgi:hypothetical protein
MRFHANRMIACCHQVNLAMVAGLSGFGRVKS